MNQDKKLTVVLLEPNKVATVAMIDGSLSGLQQTVGGYIEAIYPFEDPDCCLVCNEEGKINGLPLNRALYDETGDHMLDIIAGPCFICDCSGENFASLPDEKIEHFLNLFRFPENFFRLPNGKIMAIPYEPEEDKSEPTLFSRIQSAETKAADSAAEPTAKEHNPER